MKRVVYSTVPEAPEAVLFRFVVPQEKYWYDRNVQPVIDGIIDAIPKDERVHDRLTHSWSVPKKYWPAVMTYLQVSGFEVEQDAPWGQSSRHHLWDVSKLSIYLIPFLGFIQAAEVLHHFSGTARSGLYNRMWTFLVFLTIGTISFALRNRKQACALLLFALVLGPFRYAYLREWLEWQGLVWIGLGFATVVIFKNWVAADREAELLNWPWRILTKL